MFAFTIINSLPFAYTAGSVESGGSNNNNARIIVIGGGIALVIVLVALIMLIYCLHKNGSKKKYDILDNKRRKL